MSAFIFVTGELTPINDNIHRRSIDGILAMQAGEDSIQDYNTFDDQELANALNLGSLVTAPFTAPVSITLGVTSAIITHSETHDPDLFISSALGITSELGKNLYPPARPFFEVIDNANIINSMINLSPSE